MKRILAVLTLATMLSMPALETRAEPQYELKTYPMFGVPDAYQQLTEVGGTAVKGERIWKQVPITIVTRDLDSGVVLGNSAGKALKRAMTKRTSKEPKAPKTTAKDIKTNTTKTINLKNTNKK